jgi:hypothetical protein
VSEVIRLAALAASILAVCACTTQIVIPPASPTPTPTAQATPTNRPTDTPTSAPTPSPQPTLSIEHPSGATDVVLRMNEYSMPYPGMTLLAPPVFTLFGDGRAIYNLSREPYPPGIALDLRQARLTENQVDQLLADAMGPGGLADARAEYKFTELSEGTYTYFEIHAAGLDKRVSAYALGQARPGPIPDADAYRALTALAARLRTFGNDVASGRATAAGAFAPDAYEAKLSVAFHELEPNAEWPWANLAPADFGQAPDGTLIGIVTTDQAEAVADIGGFRGVGFIATGPDGVNYVFQVRPLLPDEVT